MTILIRSIEYKCSLKLLTLLIVLSNTVFAQSSVLTGSVRSENKPVENATLLLLGTNLGSATDTSGNFQFQSIPHGNYKLVVSAIGFVKIERTIHIRDADSIVLNLNLISAASTLHEVVVSGTLKEVSKLESPVPVEVYTAKFFKSNPTPSVFEALQNVNGVRPQINCNLCNTGDIHINGLEGPYTLIMIDGMPIVSGLSSVYGLSGIPQSLIDRIEIVKGPASTLYGSEAVGGLVNIITKRTINAPVFAVDVFGTSWREINVDVSGKFKAGKKAESLIGVNSFNYALPIDNNKDGFTDVTLQNRKSIFNKWNLDRKDGRVFSVAGRYITEERWGGDMNWTKEFRGGDSLYGESIHTKRWELFGTYQLPFKERISLQFSANGHNQNSAYGTTLFNATQYIGFGQLTWNKEWRNHDLLAGAAFRYTYYDDNTPATAIFSPHGTGNMPSQIYLPGLFLQDEIRINEDNKLLLGLRYDHNSIHGSRLTPRLNYKWNSKNKNNILRLSLGNGYRVVNIFTEDHAALTGARKVEFITDLKPETSWNGNVNFVKKIYTNSGTHIGIDATAFYTYFTNKIIADYETDPNKIIYNNLAGFAVSQGISLNLDMSLPIGMKILLGGTYMDVFSKESGEKQWQLFSERFTGVWNVGYTVKPIGLTIDYTGNIYSPMRLPLLSDTDPRREFSPWWSIQNLQLTKKIKNAFEIYGGIKNLLNWTPNKGNPFIIARTNDPFDKEVSFDVNGKALATLNNPYGLTFDPAYVYGPNQGIRGFLGFRYTIR